MDFEKLRRAVNITLHEIVEECDGKACRMTVHRVLKGEQVKIEKYKIVTNIVAHLAKRKMAEAKEILDG